MDTLTIAVLIGLLFHAFVLVLVSFLLIRRFPRLAGFLRVLRAVLGGAVVWHAYLALHQEVLTPVVRYAIDGVLSHLTVITAAECAGMVLRLARPAANLSAEGLMEFYASHRIHQALFGAGAVFHLVLLSILMLPYVV